MTEQERINELETRVAFQEELLDKLNDAVSRQELEIEKLTRIVKVLNQQLKTLRLDDAGTAPEDEPPPPHY